MEAATNLLADYINRAELGTALGVVGRTLARYENEPNGLPSVVIGGRKFYRLVSVREWLQKRERKPNPRRTAA